MADQLIECVPNFSEGRDMAIIKQITDAIEAIDGVKLLDVDPGAATNRTVVTFVGAPEPVLTAAVAAGRKAKELIDMRKQHGEHPRFGAMDVCPLVPVANITMDETVEWAHKLGERLGAEARISGYFYEFAAKIEERRNLAVCRAGEYEALPERLKDARWKPDFGPGTFDAGYGVTAVGAREFLVAYNVNLNTTSTRRANAIAFDVREKGRKKREGHPLTGPVAKDADGNAVWIPGSLKCVKGIGWFIKEYGICQISMNLTNIKVTPVHVAFEECKKKAEERGVRVTGSELVGLVPLEAMLEAGKHYLRMQNRSLGVPDSEIIKVAVKSMGLDDLKPFSADEKIIEYAIAADAQQERLVDMSVQDFVWETASESKAPGGGSVSAAIGAMGAALSTMVANLSSHKRGWDDRWEEFSGWAERGKACHDELLRLVDEDTNAFNQIVAAWGLPDGTAEEKQAKQRAIQDATKGAIGVPLRCMEVALESMDVAKGMADIGLEASVSDAGVAALAARSAVIGAHLNVKINAADCADKKWLGDILGRAGEIERRATALEQEILEVVYKKIGG
jgi:glutamate formiminotransferase/formiminotetrahydrofolate cyclodeaminase